MKIGKVRKFICSSEDQYRGDYLPPLSFYLILRKYSTQSYVGTWWPRIITTTVIMGISSVQRGVSENAL